MGAERPRGMRGQGGERMRAQEWPWGRSGDGVRLTRLQICEMKEDYLLGGFSFVGKNEEGVVGAEEETEGKTTGRGMS